MDLYGFAYHSRLVRCPHCRHRIEWMDMRHRNWGSPLQKCPFCQETVFNKYYKEPGLELYEDAGGTVTFSFVTVTIMFNIIILTFLDGLFREGLRRDQWLIFTVFILITLFLDYRLGRVIYGHRHADEIHQKNMDILEGRSDEQSEELRESLSRLSRKKYLDELKKNGVSVPEYFYQRIGCKKKK